MNPKNELDKISYYMLNIALAVEVGIIGAIMEGEYNGASSSGLFPDFLVAGMLSLIMCPLIMSCLLQGGIQLLGYHQYKNNVIESARALGKLNCIIYLMWSIGLGYYSYAQLEGGGIEEVIWFVISIICIVYILVPLVLLNINTHKKNK